MHDAAYRALARDVVRLRRHTPNDWTTWKMRFCRSLQALPPVGRTTRVPETLARSVAPLFSDQDTLRQQLLALAEARDT